MTDIQGLDVVVIIGVILATLLVLMVMLKSMRWEMTFRQVVMLNVFSLLLGVLLESWFRDQRETALATVGLALLLIAWIIQKFRARSHHNGGGE